MENTYKNQSNANISFIPTISIKKVEKNSSKTYTDTESNINLLEKIAKATNRSFNDVLKEVVNNFLDNGRIYDEINNKYYLIKEIDNLLPNNDSEIKEDDDNYTSS